MGFDLAQKEAKILEKMIQENYYQNGKKECNAFKFHFMGLYSGYSIMEYRKLDPGKYDWIEKFE